MVFNQTNVVKTDATCPAVGTARDRGVCYFPLICNVVSHR